jgi:high-affinity nickel-transport protein
MAFGRSPLTRPERRSLTGMAGVVVVLHVVGWGVLVGVVAPQQLAIGATGVFGIGLCVTAYVLGMRHAFDADHIAAIDNTTRALMTGDRRPLSVGFWFSLGHSTVVFALCALIAAGARALAAEVGSGPSVLTSALGLVGTTVSGLFLYLIGFINLAILVGVLRVFGGMRRGELDEVALEAQLAHRGLLTRVLRRVTGAVRRPRDMYPVGLLFGLGFDTATEVSLLILAGGAAAFALPWYAILTLPVLFAAGMTLLDGLDGVFMNLAYGWAFSRPVRKIYYNITVTVLSVAVALLIGTVQLLSILTERLGITQGPLAAIGGVGLDAVGYVVVGLFVATWVVAVTVWRVCRIEDRWHAAVEARARPVTTDRGDVPPAAPRPALAGSGHEPRSPHHR